MTVTSKNHHGNQADSSHSNSEIPFRQNRPLQIMIIGFVVIWILLAFRPVDRKDWLLENGVLVLFIGALAILYRKFRFSNFSYLLILIFFTLHAVGAHYAYQNTPIDVWAKQIFHAKRGIYDRIVHLSFGLLIAYPIREVARRVMKLKNFWTYPVAFFVILGSSAFFEIAEMWVVQLADPKLAAQYLGLQGDPFDTQKDMTMTLVGVLLASLWMALVEYFRSRNHTAKK